MKISISKTSQQKKAGFSLVEVALSLGIFSFGFISLIPMLALGLNSTRQSRDEQLTAQIAQTLIEEARQGTLTTNVAYFDFQGGECSAPQAAYTVQASFAPLSVGGAAGATSLQKLTLQVIPRGQPNHFRTYAVVLPASA